MVGRLDWSRVVIFLQVWNFLHAYFITINKLFYPQLFQILKKFKIDTPYYTRQILQTGSNIHTLAHTLPAISLTILHTTIDKKRNKILHTTHTNNSRFTPYKQAEFQNFLE